MGYLEDAILKFLTEYCEYILIKKRGASIYECVEPRQTKNIRKRLPCLHHDLSEDDCTRLWREGLAECQYTLFEKSKHDNHGVCCYETSIHFSPYGGEPVTIAGQSFRPIWTHWENHLSGGGNSIREDMVNFTFLGGIMVYYLTMHKKTVSVSHYTLSASPAITAPQLQSHRKQYLRREKQRYPKDLMNMNMNTNEENDNNNDGGNSDELDLIRRNLTNELDNTELAELNISDIEAEEEPNNDNNNNDQQGLFIVNQGGQLNIHGIDPGSDLPESRSDSSTKAAMGKLNQSFDELGIDIEITDSSEDGDDNDYDSMAVTTDDDEAEISEKHKGTYIMSGTCHYMDDHNVENIAYRGVVRPEPDKVFKSYVRPKIKKQRY